MVVSPRVLSRPAATAALIAVSALAVPARSKPQVPSPNSGQTLPTPQPEVSTEAEIIVRGERLGDRYRIPVELRTRPVETDRRVGAIDPKLACSNVGPFGCGTDTLPILTLRSGGDVTVGATKEP